MSLPRVRKSSVHCKYSSRNVADRDIEKKRGKKGGGGFASSLFAIFTPSPPQWSKGGRGSVAVAPCPGKKSTASYFFPITTRPFLRVKRVL